jgi:hypothetical protein
VTPASKKVLSQMSKNASRFNYDFAIVAGDAAFANGDQVLLIINDGGRSMVKFDSICDSFFAASYNMITTG